MSVDSSLGSSNGGRPLSPVRKYGVPRYRVTLVREGRAIPAAESVHTSEGAAPSSGRCLPVWTGNSSSSVAWTPSTSSSASMWSPLARSPLTIVHPREVFKPLILMNAGAWLCLCSDACVAPIARDHARAHDRPCRTYASPRYAGDTSPNQGSPG
jgi:DNA repair protein RadC